MSRRRRDLGKLQCGLDDLCEEVMAGAWRSASTERLIRLTLDRSKISKAEAKKRYYEANPVDGVLPLFGLTEMVLEYLRKLTLTLQIPQIDEETGELKMEPIKKRALVNVKTGLPQDKKKRDEERDVYAKDGRWVCFMGMTNVESGSVRIAAEGRQTQGREELVCSQAADFVLQQKSDTVTARDVWPEIALEISRRLRLA